MPNGFDPKAFEADLDETLRQGHQAFLGLYARQLNELAGLSRAEIEACSPGITDMRTYDALITVVKEASRVNLAQAQLKQHIEKLGTVAVSIAKRVPSLSTLFV